MSMTTDPMATATVSSMPTDASPTDTAVPIPNSHPLDAPGDHRSALNVVSWVLAVTGILIVLARFGTRVSVSRRLRLDDILITVALALALAQTAALNVAVSHDFGLTGSTADSDALASQEKAIYALNILFVASQTFTKTSVAVFIRSLTPIKPHRHLCDGFMVATGIWAITALLPLAFQCSLPDPWRVVDNKCINRVSLFVYIEVMNILLDVLLIIIPTIIIWSIKQSTHRKMMIIGTFTTRVSVIAVIIVQLVLLLQPSDAIDPFLSWDFPMYTQILDYLGIISACVLYLRPFLQNANSGMLGQSEAGTRAGTYQVSAGRIRSPKFAFHNNTRNGTITSAVHHDKDNASTTYLKTDVDTSVMELRDQSLDRQTLRNDSPVNDANCIIQTRTYEISSVARAL